MKSVTLQTRVVFASYWRKAAAQRLNECPILWRAIGGYAESIAIGHFPSSFSSGESARWDGLCFQEMRRSGGPVVKLSQHGFMPVLAKDTRSGEDTRTVHSTLSVPGRTFFGWAVVPGFCRYSGSQTSQSRIRTKTATHANSMTGSGSRGPEVRTLHSTLSVVPTRV